MKNLKQILFFVFMAFAIKTSATQYIIIHHKITGRYSFTYVPKPENLKKWYYDSKNDIYYWTRGMRVETKFKITETNATHTQYVIVNVNGWTQRYRFKYVHKPKDLKKWYYDSKNDIYYRGKVGLGIPAKIKSEIRIP